MRKQRAARRGVGVLSVAFLVLAVVLGALLLRKYEGARKPPSVPAVQGNVGYRQVVLFFSSASGEHLAREGRDIEPCEEISGCLEEILGELINGPVGDLEPVLPVTGMFNSVRLDGEIARVDFARELLEALPSGSRSEMLAAYSIVNSLAINYRQVRAVAFTIDGKPMPTMKGHLDTSVPLTPDFSLEKPAAAANSPGRGKQ